MNSPRRICRPDAKARLFWGVSLTALVVGLPARGDCTLTSTGKTPLNDLGKRTYLGQQGGLYPGGTNTRPPAHEAAGLLIAENEILPRDPSGNVDLINGKIVLISVGMSNTVREFATVPPGAFLPRFLVDPSHNPRLIAVNCAQGDHTAKEWRDPANNAWTVCASRLSSAGVTAAQVQVAWVKLAERAADVPDQSFPAHALFHEPRLGDVLRLLRINFPRLGLAFMSSRTRCYENNPNSLNPEPFAYEENFSVKWLIEEQINGVGNLNYDPSFGPVVAPYIAWGPYIWTDGENPRSDGFVWHCSDVRADDFTHPSESGVTKVADQLIAFFKTDPLARTWFLKTTVTGAPPTVNLAPSTTSGRAPLTVDFSSNAVDPDGSIAETAWTFGDGGYSMAANPTKTYPVPGDYVVHLTATDNSGNSTTASHTITVLDASVPATSAWGITVLAIAIAVAATLVLYSRTEYPSPREEP